MPAKYNNKNIQHRLWLAQNLLSVLEKWGFEIDNDDSIESWEFVLSKWDKYDITKKIIVYTSIDKTSGSIRPMGSDAIRIVALRLRNNDENLPLYRKKVNRTGEFKNIVNRTINAIKEAQRK
tara:strand:- start:607 stop:972 length:366 start_codon:yes stop_codon:yes gene_type:complete